MNIRSILHNGAKGTIVDVECHLSNGLPAIVIVGLGNKAIEESKERIRSALASSKLPLPRKRITINLAPADIPKESTSLDLAIATAILQASEQVKQPPIKQGIIVGELGLDGAVRPVRGVIGKIIAARQQGFTNFLVPAGNLQQALLVPGVSITPVDNLHTLKLLLNRELDVPTQEGGLSTLDQNITPSSATRHFSEVIGQQQAKRGAHIAAAGGHNIFLTGPPGTGKSMLAKALPAILPPLNSSEMLDVTHLYSLTSPNYDHLVTLRPFRAPHHSASHIAMIGGGSNLRPGEVSLSHRGVLFLDELPEFQRQTIEALRQPLEDGYIVVSRAKDSVQYPADFILVATANPCPCGFYGTDQTCTCSAHAIAQYRQKVSRPILDRVDLYVDMERIDHTRLLDQAEGPGDADLQRSILLARQVQAKRYQSAVKLNATMSNQDIKHHAHLAKDAKAILDQAAKSLQLSARGYMRAIKVARTIADLDTSTAITKNHITEALRYRYAPVT